MLEEAQAFAQVLKGGQEELYSDYLQAAAAVHDCIFAMRKDAGIRFEVDHD
ncbi:oxidoreductase, Gfo/Idh/MocA family [Streptococcus sp. DD04]|nr:oxidoreductase, Gfo/Idh/MocA family [Streptococcus sp. DD04]